MILVTNKMKVTGLVILKSGYSIPEPLIEEDNGGLTDPVTETNDDGNVNDPVTETDDRGPVSRKSTTPTEPETPETQPATFNWDPGSYDLSINMGPNSQVMLSVSNRNNVVWNVSAGSFTNQGGYGTQPTPYGETSNETAKSVEFGFTYVNGGPFTQPWTVSAYDAELDQTFNWNFILYHEEIG